MLGKLCPLHSFTDGGLRQKPHDVAESQNLRRVEVGRVLTSHLAPHPCSKQGQLEQVIQDFVQSDFEHVEI